MIYQSIAMAPMGFGVLLLYPVTKKIGSRKTVMIGSLICVVFSILCIMKADNVMMAFAGSFMLNFGVLAMTYLNITFVQQANDVIEYEHGYRPEGTMLGSIITILSAAILSPMQGLYETGLFNLGYDAYASSQNAAVIRWIVLVWYGAVLVKGLVTFICLIFFDTEKRYPNITAELKERNRKAVEARGEVWIDEEEQERLEKEEGERIAEENRIRDLKEKCEKKGLDFEKENQKYLDKAAKKKEKAKKHGKKI